MNINLAPFSSSTFSSDCWIIHNSPRAARPDLGLKEGEAARLALQELEKLKGTDAHRLSLAPAVHSLQQLQLLFQSLDKYLFRKVLKDNVSLRLTSELLASIHGSTSALDSFSSQIVITLNSDLTRHPTQLALVASLIHQMSHAYLLVCCGFGDSDGEDERHDLKHGLAFSSIVHTIQDLLVDDARIPLPDLFYCNGTMSRSARLPRYRPCHQSLHSYCHFNFSDHEGKIACAAYMRHVIAAAKAKSSESSSKEDPPSANVFQSIGTLGGLMNR
jgi:SprT-like family